MSKVSRFLLGHSLRELPHKLSLNYLIFKELVFLDNHVFSSLTRPRILVKSHFTVKRFFKLFSAPICFKSFCGGSVSLACFHLPLCFRTRAYSIDKTKQRNPYFQLFFTFFTLLLLLPLASFLTPLYSLLIHRVMHIYAQNQSFFGFLCFS